MGWRELGTIQLLSAEYSLQSSQGIGGSGSVSWRNIIGDSQGGKHADLFSLCTVISLPRYGEVRYGQMTLGVGRVR